MNKAISAAVFAAGTALALGGCAPAATTQPMPVANQTTAVAGPAPKNEVAIENFIVGRWHCTGDSKGEVAFFGFDSNLVKAVRPDVEFDSNGLMTQYMGPGKNASESRDDEWEYKDGALLMGQTFVKIPEYIQIPGTAKIELGHGIDPTKSEAKTEITFGPNSMTMKVAQYLDGHKAKTDGLTVTCRK